MASKKKIRGRSKMNKAQLYEALSGLIDQFAEIKIEDQDENIEDYLVGEMEKMSIEEDSPPKGSFGFIQSYKYFDYVVVDCPSTSEAFPVLVECPDEGKGGIKWNDFMYHFFGCTHNYEGVWVTTESMSGPIGLKSDFNSPINVHFKRYKDASGKSRLAYATVFPLVDPKTAGFQDILDKYGVYDVDEGYYHVNTVIDFCREIIERCVHWDFAPVFVEELEKALHLRGVDFRNKVVFADVPCKEMEDLQEVFFDYPNYSNCKVARYERFKTPEGSYVAYLKLK